MKNSSIDHNQEKDLADGVIAREIVQEILKYGVNQFQIEKIINLLALELEDNQKLKDVCDAIIKATFSKQKNQIYNVGFGYPKSINHLLKLIKGKKTYIPKRPGEPNITHADISKIKKELKWKPRISLEDGIKDVINNIDYWKDTILWDKKKIKKATKNWFKYLK